MIKGNISSFDTMGLVDGPGIRFVVFLQGCQLRCKYCHNPETWDANQNKNLMTPQELIDKALRYKNYYGEEGGVTFSGGEPLLQPDFLIECTKLCKKHNIHTCLDTAGFGIGKEEEVLKNIDLVILDIKATNNALFNDITGQNMNKTQKFLQLCQKLNKKMWIRQVIVPGINDSEESVLSLKEFLKPYSNIEKIELLPYKTIGVHKYNDLKIRYRLDGVPEMDEEKCKELNKLLFI